MMNSVPSKHLLVVDVDGTLCPVDTLQILRIRWRLKHPLQMRRPNRWRSISKQFEKIQLWEHVGFSCAPRYNRAVIDVVQQWLKSNKDVIVVSGSAAELANWAAAGLSDVESFGSTQSINLTKKNKADFLTTNFPDYQITYIGDSPDDMHVWERCYSAIYVRNRKLAGLKIKTMQNSVTSIANESFLSRTRIWIQLLFS